MNARAKPTRSIVSGIVFFAMLMLVIALVDYFVAIPPNVLKAAIAGSAISALAVAV